MAQLTALVEAHERLLSRARELADRREPAAAGPLGERLGGPVRRAPRRSGASSARCQTLPEVRSAVVRGYEGADRAIVDVHLVEPTS